MKEATIVDIIENGTENNQYANKNKGPEYNPCLDSS